MTKPIPDALREPVTNLDEAKCWIATLVRAGLSFHLEDDPADLYVFADGTSLFTTEDADLIRDRVSACYDLEWGPRPMMGKWYCPIGYMMREEFLQHGQLTGTQADGHAPGACLVARYGDLALIDTADMAAYVYGEPGRFQVWRDSDRVLPVSGHDTLEEALAKYPDIEAEWRGAKEIK